MKRAFSICRKPIHLFCCELWFNALYIYFGDEGLEMAELSTICCYVELVLNWIMLIM